MYVCGLDSSQKQTADPGPSNSSQTYPDQRSSPKPASTPDKATLMSDLMRLENDITEAAMNGDITLLTRSTTDDFELTGVDGKVQNKNQALSDVKKEKNIKSFTITEPELLSFSEDSAVLRYTLTVTVKNGRSGRARVTDSFVKKDGRWLVKSEQQTLIK
jgi:hypothetical protein